MSAANRNRGARAEVQVVNYLRTQGWPDTRRYLAGDGRQPGDIDWHPLICLEVKDVAQSCWPTWCRQAHSEARSGMVPFVVRRERGQPDVGRWPCRFPILSDFPMTPEDIGYEGTVYFVDGGMWVATNMDDLVQWVRMLDAAPAVSGEGTA